jgi:hypothetical protein
MFKFCHRSCTVVLWFDRVVQKTEKPNAKKRNYIPNDESGKERGDGHHVFTHANIHVKRMVHKPWANSWSQRYPSKAHDVNDRRPWSCNFEEVSGVDHFLSFEAKMSQEQT